MLPPTHVYSAIIRNHTGKDVTVEVTYSNLVDGTSEKHLMEISAGGKVTAEERHFTNGGATYAIVITSVQVKGGNAKLESPFPHVTSPTKEYSIIIKDEAGAIKLYGEKK